MYLVYIERHDNVMRMDVLGQDVRGLKERDVDPSAVRCDVKSGLIRMEEQAYATMTKRTKVRRTWANTESLPYRRSGERCL